MWGQKWGQMVWSGAHAAPALGPWVVLLLGCVLGIIAVVALRSRRKVGLVVLLLVLLVPLSAFAAVPFIFANGTTADALQINADFAAVIPLIAKSSASTTASGTTPIFVFPASFVAPRSLTCVVTFEPYVVSGSSTAQIVWRTAIQVGTQQSLGPSPGPGPLSMIMMPSSNGIDRNYTGTYTDIFSVAAGSSVSFGANFQSQDGAFYQPQITTVYSCTTPP